jgi:hypothetical protein
MDNLLPPQEDLPMWDYRVVKRVQIMGKETFVTYGIHEVYYDEKHNPFSITEDSIQLYGETVLELLRDWKKISSAFTKPILDYDEFINKDIEDITMSDLTASGNTTFKFDDKPLPWKDTKRLELMHDRKRENDEIIYGNECVGKPEQTIFDFVTDKAKKKSSDK